MIFSLPFHVARFFRPTLLNVFSVTNTQIGDSFAIYGITAMICYFPGGLIADRFSARKLLTISLLATAVGGLYFAQIPEGLGLYVLFGYWGFTSVLMFWAGMLKATRDWGGSHNQGRAFGLLDGGRGLAAALMSTIAVFIFSYNVQSLQAVIYFYTFITTFAAFLVWKNIPDTESELISERKPFDGVMQVISSRRIWLQAIIIICAYSAYKGLDNYGLYAVQVLSMNDVNAAAFTSLAAYLRPVGAVLAGFALRGIYFALVEESKVGRNVTGTVIGFVSLVGYTPDILFPSITGRILDADAGIIGFQYYFSFLAMTAVIGLIASFALHRLNRNKLAKA